MSLTIEHRPMNRGVTFDTETRPDGYVDVLLVFQGGVIRLEPWTARSLAAFVLEQIPDE